jgi:hypothetical protein
MSLRPRLRQQLVLAAAGVDETSTQLHQLLASPAYRDPAVAEFGLANAVHAVGDGFVEVVAPVAEDTAVGRHLERGRAGYMAMAEVADVEQVRRRAVERGVRVAWEVTLPGVTDLHLHPKDVGGAILAVDEVDPPGSWPWGGPGWSPRPGGLRALAIEVPEPAATCATWGALLGGDQDGDALRLGDQVVRFVAGDRGIVAGTLALPAPPARTAIVAGVRLDLEAL